MAEKGFITSTKCNLSFEECDCNNSTEHWKNQNLCMNCEKTTDHCDCKGMLKELDLQIANTKRQIRFEFLGLDPNGHIDHEIVLSAIIDKIMEMDKYCN